MVDGHPAGLSAFFLDRSLGRRQVPDILRAAGIELQTLSEVYGIPADEEVSDAEWLELAGRRRWPVLMKDQKIRYRSAEREALISHGVQAFCLTSGKLRAATMATHFLLAMDEIAEACATPGPFLYSVSQHGARKLSL